MTAKSRIISHFLFFFVFLVLVTDLVHGDPYHDCLDFCEYYDEGQDCFDNCQDLKNGRIGIIQNSSEKSLVNHGVAILEANPNTFMAPGHWDADVLFFVVQGKATINLIRRDKRETLGLKTGDIIRIPSGTKVLMMNKDRMEKLVVIKLPQPVSTPAGRSEVKLLNPFGDQSSQQQQLAEGIRSVV
ncbi:vicilin Cor a 11.0101-like [Impatiens glandulifera]|uniref:vicilin Cor a 11.0101-like n=1 Tax=Impatiens glandulifera TaxID=253017 RepID=UPI001FB05CDD|nr:vicilin Cor a 11.0101-like [Impatiens glandulifera]